MAQCEGLERELRQRNQYAVRYGERGIDVQRSEVVEMPYGRPVVKERNLRRRAIAPREVKPETVKLH